MVRLTIYVKIKGMTCGHCEDVIRKKLLKIKNIDSVSFDNGVAIVECSSMINKDKIIKTIIDSGYYTKDSYISDKNKFNKISLFEFILISLILVFIFLIIYFIFGYNIFNVIPTISDNVTYGMLFVIGLLTSIHCISMCGAINIMNFIGNKSINRSLYYNIGRVLSYTIIGGVVGLIGNVLSFNNIISGIIIIVASIFMFIMSLNLLGIVNIKLKRFDIKSSSNNSFIIGLLNGLMPCGPLQAMEVYALSTKSMLRGALSMFLFGIGTVPLMLCSSFIFGAFKGKSKLLVNKVASILVLILSIVMLSRGISTLGFNINYLFMGYNNYKRSTIYSDYQVVKINLSYDNYDDIIVQKGIKVKLIINVSSEYLTGCNNRILINKFNINKELNAGKNIIYFNPNEVGTYSMNCWMNMIKNNIKVIDDKNYFEVVS